MLIDGEVDAALIGDKFPDPRFKTLVPDAEAANKAWAEKNGGVPVNHMVIVREKIAKERPDVVRELFRVLKEARAADDKSPKGALDPYRFGVEANRKALEKIIDYSVRQQMIKTRFTVDELFDDVTRALSLTEDDDAASARSRSSTALLARHAPASAQNAAAQLPEPADQDRGAVPGRRADRHQHPHHRAEALRSLGPGRGDREPARRQHRHRRVAGGEVAGRRLHAACGNGHDTGDEPGDRREHELRPVQGFHADHHHREEHLAAHGARRRRAEDHQGADRARQGVRARS